MPKSRIRIQRDAVLPRIEKIRDYWICVVAIEGEKTEKQYFEKFRELLVKGGTQVKIDVLPTLAGDSQPESIIDRLIKYQLSNDLQVEDKCWLVFDVDDRNDERLQAVYEQAKEKHFQVAISNPCFEFWLFLHKFEANELPQSIHQLSVEKRPQEMKQILHTFKCDYHSLAGWEFREYVVMAVQRAKSKETGRRSVVPGFPGSDVYKVIESLPLKAIAD